MSFKAEFEQSIYQPWSSEYVAYTPIYESLQQLCQNGSWSFEDEKDFESAIRLEATKVNQFIYRKQREFETRINKCQRLLSSHADTTLKQSTDDELTYILADVNELSRYTRFNFKALENLIQEHDRWTRTDRHSLLVEISRTRPLDSQRFDPILAKVSTLLDVCRERQRSSGSSIQERHPLPTYARYWIHPDNITEVKAILLFNLPMYTEHTSEEAYEQSDRSKTIVYFDNNQFSHYAARLQRDDGAQVINCHWNENAVNVTFERRIHKKTDTGGQTISESVEINKHLAQDFISGGYTAEEYAEEIKRIGQHHQNDISTGYTTARTIQATILEQRLAPKVRISFNRLLFKSPRDKHLSISLDSNILFTKEDDELFPQDMEPRESHLFPHAILEARVDQGEPPSWLLRLLQSRLVFEVPRFSSYLHGVAEFYSPQLALLPWWLARLDTDIRTAAVGSLEYSGLSRSDSFKPLIDGQYRAGYLETQLDRQRSNDQASLGNRVTRSSGYSSSSTIYNSKNPVASETSADAKDTVIQVENAMQSSNPSIYFSPSNSLSNMRSQSFRSRKSDQSSKFIDYYKKKRNKHSEGYVLNNVETIKEDDALRQGAVIQMENEVKQKKKNKGKKFKPPTHTMEPKVFFANERTFINWLQFAALIMTAALTLLNFGDRISTISGGTFFGISIVLALYAFFRYRFRAHQINTRPDIRYDDMYGPVGLTCLLVGAMAVSIM